MAKASGGVKVHNTRNIDELVSAVLDLHAFLNSPQRDDTLLREARVNLDRALFPLLVALGRKGALAVAELAGLVGRDHTTVSRQLAKLESLGMVERCASPEDRRVRAARLTEAGEGVVRQITEARRSLLTKVLAGWEAEDVSALARLSRRFADTLIGFDRA